MPRPDDDAVTADASPQRAADLPAGWTWTTLGEACNVIMGQSPPSDTYNSEQDGLPFYQGKTEFGDLYPTPAKWCSKPNKIAEAGDVLISVRAPVGPTNLCRETSCIGRGLAAIRPINKIPSKYVLYALRYFENELAEKATGTTFSAISGTTLRNQRFPLAPLAEQRRIVAAIESLFTKLEAGVAALKRAQANLRRYKASVLKAACEGKLTAQDPRDESASELLASILRERRAKGKDFFKTKYEEPLAPNIDGLPELPKGWCWVKTSLLNEVVDPHPTHRTPPVIENGIPYVGMGDISNGKIDLENARKVSKDVLLDHQSRYVLRDGDFIFGKIGTLGKPVKLSRPFDYALSANVVLLQPYSEYVKPEFSFVYMASPLMERILQKESRATTQAAFGILKMRDLAFPLPPLAEQGRIVAEVERRLSVVAALEQTLAHNLARAEKLRQAILKKAFAGRLVGHPETA